MVLVLPIQRSVSPVIGLAKLDGELRMSQCVRSGYDNRFLLSPGHISFMEYVDEN